MIDKKYRAIWEIDNLPCVSEFIQPNNKDPSNNKHYFLKGYFIGQNIPELNNKYMLYNFLNITIYVHHTGNKMFQIIGFNITPSVAKYNENNGCEIENEPNFLTADKNISYYYQVNFVETKKEWSSRWDIYLQNIEDTNIRWLSICNSIFIVLVLTYIVAHMMRKSLKKDIEQYNAPADLESAPSAETGWKRLKSDVFRPPVNSLIFTSLVATGFQFLIMLLTCIGCAMIGIIRSEIRGELLTAMIVAFIGMGILSGYIAGRYKNVFEIYMNNFTHAIVIAFFIPSIFFIFYAALNSILWINKEHGYVFFLIHNNRYLLE